MMVSPSGSWNAPPSSVIAESPTSSVRHRNLPTATFVYVDPGKDTDTELRSWGAAHE